jgi:hypothetical protein
LYLDVPGAATVQGRRKEIDSVVARVSASAVPFFTGVNQPDASTQQGMVTVPWTGMSPVQGPPSGNNPLQPNDLVSGDIFTNVIDALGLTNGQIAVQQTEPLPLNLLALVCAVRIQDDISPE